MPEAPAALRTPRIALVGSPNAGKTSVFNGLTGLRAKTGNYPGVTVGRTFGNMQIGGRRGHEFVVEDLPGAYSLSPVSPDEKVVADALTADPPDALVMVVDSTTLQRSLVLIAEVLRLHLPTAIVLTLTDELVRRSGRVDAAGLARALGVPVVEVIANRGTGINTLKSTIDDWQHWTRSPIDPPFDRVELGSWAESVLDAADYQSPRRDRLTERIDAVLLHPVWGTMVFAAVMFGFFQVIFSVAAPLQGLVETLFGWLSGLVDAWAGGTWVGSLLGDALIGGVGAVFVFVPQIMLMFLLISLLEGVGYMSRAAFLMDRVMATAGLEGRAFVALLSSFACAIPGIMATRTLPSARDRIATMMAVPLMTCSARLPVYVLLIGMLVPADARFGFVGAQGLIMFGLYVLGAVSAMLAAWVVKRAQGGRQLMPFYMEMPPYRIPTLRSVLASMWMSSKAFLRKCGTIILGTTIVLWLLLNLPLQSLATMQAAGVDTDDDAAVTAYVMDNSAAAAMGRFVEPVFAPLGFDWRVNVGVIASLSARETFVATLGQIASADDPENPQRALAAMTYTSGEHAGERVFTPATIAALLVFFVFALQCMSTIGVMRRESGSWKWPAIAWGYMFALAWCSGFAAHTIVSALGGAN